MVPDSPVVDLLRAAAVLERRYPACFHAAIRRELWGALGDYYAACGGSWKDGFHVLAPLGVIVAVNPLNERGLGN